MKQLMAITLLKATTATFALLASLGLSSAALSQTQNDAASTDLKVLATYPNGNFLENLEVQEDGRLLFTNYPAKSIEVLNLSGETETFATLSAYPLSLKLCI